MRRYNVNCRSVSTVNKMSTVNQCQLSITTDSREGHIWRTEMRARNTIFTAGWRYSSEYRINCAFSTFKAIHGLAPKNLAVSCQPLSTITSRQSLRLATAGGDLFVPLTILNTKFGDRAFSVAGTHAWNSLPLAVGLARELETFKRWLNQHLFAMSYIN